MYILTYSFILLVFVSLHVSILCDPAAESYKNQYCTDPRTMKKHAAYSEWADAYSCTKHRCQPGGRNLAIYTVGCKRVEAPESAIECEEVVEDTNIQFPFCCTRLRCLVVVRGEVWTRVLGQPWETLPAAPWSHMYKMKKPPPSDTSFLPKNGEKGPVYELAEPETNSSNKMLRTKKTSKDSPDCNEAVPRAVPTPDIVIALSTNNNAKEPKKPNKSRQYKRGRHNSAAYSNDEQKNNDINDAIDREDASFPTEKSLEPFSEERITTNIDSVTQKSTVKAQPNQVNWMEINQNQWNDHEAGVEIETNKQDGSYHQPDFSPQSREKIEEKPSNLQALVDAIGSRMRDIEGVVQRMSAKVHHNKATEPEQGSSEKRSMTDTELEQKKQKIYEKDHENLLEAIKTGPDKGPYKRGSKYLRSASGATTEAPFVEDNNMNGYFNDASNSILRRANLPKEPVETYMAPVETHHNEPAHIIVSDSSDESEKKKKKHHKKRRGKGHGHKRHKKEEKKKSKINSGETDKNIISIEDNYNSAVAST